MSAKDFQLKNKLGEGSFSSVWKVVRISDGKEYAMKKVKINSLSDKEKENALNEVRILASIQSPYIIGYKEAFFDDDSMTLCIVMEFAANGDISNQIQQHTKNQTNFPEKEIWKIFIQLLKALNTLHDKKIVHRDIKSANIFLSADGTAKMGDLNVSKVAKGNLVYTQAGTPYYASPEVWRDEPYDAKCDIWSLGCVIYEMAALKPPFRANDLPGLYKKIQKGSFDRIPSQYSLDLLNIITLCLQTSATQRPSCEELLNNPIVVKHSRGLVPHISSEKSKFELLSTIKVPKNIKALGQQLPKPNYDQLDAVIEEPRTKIVEKQLSEKKRPRSVIEKERPIEINNPVPVKKVPERGRSAGVRHYSPLANKNDLKSPGYCPNKPPLAKNVEAEIEFLQRMQKEYLERANPYTNGSSKDSQIPAPQIVVTSERARIPSPKVPNRKPLLVSPRYNHFIIRHPENGRSVERDARGILKERPTSQNHIGSRNYLLSPGQHVSNASNDRGSRDSLDEAGTDPYEVYVNQLKEKRKNEQLNNISTPNYHYHPVNLPKRNRSNSVLQRRQSNNSNSRLLDPLPSYRLQKENPVVLDKKCLVNLSLDKKNLVNLSAEEGSKRDGNSQENLVCKLKSPIYQNNLNHLKHQLQLHYKY